MKWRLVNWLGKKFKKTAFLETWGRGGGGLVSVWIAFYGLSPNALNEANIIWSHSADKLTIHSVPCSWMKQILCFLTYSNVFSSSQSSCISDVQIRAPICELSRKYFSGPNVDSDTVESRPRNSVSMHREQLADAARQQVQLGALLVKAFYKYRQLRKLWKSTLRKLQI